MEGNDRTFRVNFSSDGVSKLREVVKEKLKEFMGDYTDDTLVEYVIVLLKNGRRKDEAKSELNVFLGDDSDSFVSWLWDHLGSYLSVYVQPQDIHPNASPKTKPSAEEQTGKPESRKIESKVVKGDSNKTSWNHHNQEGKGLVRNGNENEAPISRNSVAENEISQDEPHPRAVRIKSSLSPRPAIQKKRRGTDEHQPRKREVSQSKVSAPRRLLQFAVRDAVATTRPSISMAEPSLGMNSSKIKRSEEDSALTFDTSAFPSKRSESGGDFAPQRKRLRSVVSASPGDSSLEERPQRIPRASMSAAIKAMSEAVKDVSKVRPSRNVFDRLGHTTDLLNTNNHPEYGGAADDVGGGDFSVKTENFRTTYHPRNVSGRLQEENIMSSAHDAILDSNLGYDVEGYDDFDERGQESADIYPSRTPGGSWVEKSQMFQYGDGDSANERLHRSQQDLGQPTTVPTRSLRIASSVSMVTRNPAQYQEKKEVSETDNHKIMETRDTVATKSEAWLMKENGNPTVAFHENVKPGTITRQSEKNQTSTGLQNIGPPTEDADSRTIFLSNVHFAATKDSLSRHFNKFGEILKVIILTDPATGQPKGSAYIEFMRKDAAELALSLDGTSFMSRILKIVRKSAAQPEAASVMTWPRIARASHFAVPRFGRAPFARGTPSLYRARIPVKPGARSFQWKREADSSVPETSTQAPNSIIPPPTIRSLTYVRTEPPKTNGNSGSV